MVINRDENFPPPIFDTAEMRSIYDRGKTWKPAWLAAEWRRRRFMIVIERNGVEWFV